MPQQLITFKEFHYLEKKINDLEKKIDNNEIYLKGYIDENDQYYSNLIAGLTEKIEENRNRFKTIHYL